MKAQRRSRAEAIATNRMLLDVPKADVVIVNPTHFAVALKWTRAKGTAPVCVAKGEGEVALRIREVAATAGIPLHSDPPTARALFATVAIGREIAPEHYRAVAAAIRFSDRMRRAARARGAGMTPEALRRLTGLAEARKARDLARLDGLLTRDRQLAGRARRPGRRRSPATSPAAPPLPPAQQALRQAWVDQRIRAAARQRAALAAGIAAARAAAVQSLGKHRALEHLVERGDRDARQRAPPAPSARRRRPRGGRIRVSRENVTPIPSIPIPRSSVDQLSPGRTGCASVSVPVVTISPAAMGRLRGSARSPRPGSAAPARGRRARPAPRPRPPPRRRG